MHTAIRCIFVGGIAVLAVLVTDALPPADPSPHMIGVASAATIPQLRTDIYDAEGLALSGSDAQEGTPLHISAELTGAGGAPSGAVHFETYDTEGCGGAPSSVQSIALTRGSVAVPHSTEVSNAAGSDSATIWSSQSGGAFGTDWAGSLFVGTDPPFFSHSGAGWRFAGVPLTGAETIDSAYLLLRISRSRPNLASETFGTWRTAIRIDAASGAGFDGMDHDSFLARFASAGVPWQVPYSYAQSDPFGTQQGAAYARSPDITALVAARIGSAVWDANHDIVLGILDDASTPTAESQIIDAPDNVRLHIDWTAQEPAGLAASATTSATIGWHSYRVHYDGDPQYAPTVGTCVGIEVAPKDTDGDGYGDAVETAMGKNPLVYCEVMRADVDGDGVVSILDLSSMAQSFGDSAPPAPRRLLQGDDAQISIIDLSRAASQFLNTVSICP